jgi:hypothetical protein
MRAREALSKLQADGGAIEGTNRTTSGAIGPAMSAEKTALEKCLDVMLRMIPDLCGDHDEEPCTDEEHNEAIEQAAVTLYGGDRKAWPAKVLAVVEGAYS